MASTAPDLAPPQPEGATAVVVLKDGSLIWGHGFGAVGHAPGEIVFNTAMTGYQEVLTDPSYAAQIITFTFPHIGNVGTNDEDMETTVPAAKGCIVRQSVTEPSNWRALSGLTGWMAEQNLIGISGVDTRALTRRIRTAGSPDGVIAHAPDGKFDLEALKAAATGWPGLEGMDLAIEVTRDGTETWDENTWALGSGYGAGADGGPRVVAIDYGAKRNILRCLVQAGCRVTVVPATATADDILKHEPDGVFLSNGPGDPAATASHAVPVIQALLEKSIPIFGICLGHQLLSLALGAKTYKLKFGHRGANQPVKDLTTGKVEITSQNHGFAVDRASLPVHVEETHTSLFDGIVEGIRATTKPAFSVQYHPEASPGPQDSHYLFDRFVDLIKAEAA